MSRADRRRFDKEFAKLMKAAPDVCGICGRRFPHNSKTFGGFGRGGLTVLAGECCQNRLLQIYVSGVYVAKNFDHLVHIGTPAATGDVASSDANSFVEVVQGHFKAIEAQAERVALKAGLRDSSAPVFLGDSPWKSDDAAWFKSNPERSHRLRVMFDGELDTTHPLVMKMRTLADHRIEILVRQVEVGQRVRAPFARNLAVEIPDVEEIAHALFDLVTQSDRDGVLAFEDVAALAKMYAASFDGKAS